jgi:hypothetical protein
MFQYANDNNQQYPDGNSSTEVFQKLIDGGYITDPAIVYIPMAGKIKSTSLHLKPENVCFDVTSPADANTPDVLPIVFSTGYKVNYVPGGTVVPIVKPYPLYMVEDHRTLWQKLFNRLATETVEPGIAVCYKTNSATFHLFDPSTATNPNGSIPNFVPPDFDARGKTYRQLTPDGVLPGN